MTATTFSQLADYKAWTFAERLRPLRAPWRSFRRRLLRKPGSTMAMMLATLAGGVIITNALALQTERHPSPMFTSLAAEPVQQVAAKADALPLPPTRAQAERRAEADAPIVKASARSRDEPQRTASIATTSKEQMLAIINGGAPEKVADAAAPTPRIVQIQKALSKAGYGSLKPDGVFGAGTRAALEKFEADRKLPVRGEPQGRTLRELARVSGMALD